MIWDVDQYLIVPNIGTVVWSPSVTTLYRSLVRSEAELEVVNARLEKKRVRNAASWVKRKAHGTKGRPKTSGA